MEKIKIDSLKEIKVELPASVIDPKPLFNDTESAIQHYGKQLEGFAANKNISIDELKIKANNYEFGAEESFIVLGLLDTIRALKATR